MNHERAMRPDEIDLLMLRADDHLPALDRSLCSASPAQAPAPAPLPRPDTLWDEGGEGNDLLRQRWGIIAPRGEAGDRLLDVMAPLIVRRRAQQDGHPVRIYRVPARMSLAQAARWKKRVFRKEDDVDDDLPRYQLVLGDLDQVPLAIQQVQATDGFVGRLAFDCDDHYRAYVDKVLGWEDRPAAASLGHAILHTVHDGTTATKRGHDALMAPGLALLEKNRMYGKVCAADIRATGTRRPDPAQLAAAAATDRPSVLFTMSHGLGAPRAGWTAQRQRREQGALGMGPGAALYGHDLAGRSFLPGGVWFMFACFGAGTPDTSAYGHWLDTLCRAGHVGHDIEHVLNTLAPARPFVAALPKAVLASPDGPLAVAGHIDLAWAYSFLELDDRPVRRPGRFVGVVQALLRRDRAGLSLRSLTRFVAQTNTELTALYDHRTNVGGASLDPATRTRLGHLWMLRQDLAGYVLLGDPAVRLPLAAGQATPAPHISGRAVDHIEAAVEYVMAGRSIAEAARALAVESADLERWLRIYRQAGRRALAAALHAGKPSAGNPNTGNKDGA